MTPPDSGEREVCSQYFLRTGPSLSLRCTREYGHAGSHRVNTELVSLPLPLAQRILAALETGMAGTIGEAQKHLDLARELRAAVERKP